jgi:hypothetical protein
VNRRVVLVADIGEEESLVDDDIGGILVVKGVGGALVGVPFPTHVGIAALLLVVHLLLLLFPLLSLSLPLSLDVGHLEIK